MYYLSTMSSVFVIKFTLHNSNSEDYVKEEVTATAFIVEPPPTADAVSQISLMSH